mgnify:CR=1 FL=1
MEIYCSFQSIAGGVCGADSWDKKPEIRVVPLLACYKDISQHRKMFSFNDSWNEVDLILCRAGIFTSGDDLSTMTICPLHWAWPGLDKRGKHMMPSYGNHDGAYERQKEETLHWIVKYGSDQRMFMLLTTINQLFFFLFGMFVIIVLWIVLPSVNIL